METAAPVEFRFPTSLSLMPPPLARPSVPASTWSPAAMQSSSQAVCLNVQQPGYSDGKEEDGGFFRLRSALGFQIQQVKDHVLWSLCNFAFWNCCCLGFAALVFSIKSRDRKVVGDVEGASSYGKTALCLNITALLVGILFFSVFIALIFTGVIALKNVFFAFGFGK